MYTRQRQKGLMTLLPPVGDSIGSYYDGRTVTSAAGYQQVKQTPAGPYVVTQDCITPGFHRRRANGEISCNPFRKVSEIRVIKDKPWGHARVTPLFTGESTGAFKGWEFKSVLHSFSPALATHQPSEPYGPDLPGITDIRTRNAASLDVAFQAAMSNMATTSALTAVTMAEGLKTVQLLGHYASALRRQANPLVSLVTRIKRGQISPAQASKMLGDEWMKFRYGALPLIYEIKGVVKALNANQVPQRQTARGKTAFTDSVTRSFIAPAGPYRGTDRYSITKVSCTVRAGILYEPMRDSLCDRLGISVLSLPETVFELTKLSWMADWFMNLSDTVRAISAPLYGRFLCGWTTETYECHTQHTFAAGIPGVQKVVVNNVQKDTSWDYSSSPVGAQVDVFFTAKIRTPVLDMRLRMPRIRNRMSATHVVDVLALVASQFKAVSKIGTVLSPKGVGHASRY